jgi:hypothetical protein
MSDPFSSSFDLIIASISGAAAGVASYYSRTLAHRDGMIFLRNVLFIIGNIAICLSALLFTRLLGITSIPAALALVLLLSAWISLLHNFQPLPLPPVLMPISRAEYGFLQSPLSGVRAYGWLLIHTPIRRLGGAVFVTGTGPAALAKMLPGLTGAETVHVWSVIALSPLLIVWIWMAAGAALATSLLVILIFHIYPIAHLRMVRYRLNLIQKRHTD